jgi:hypothetical protein
VQADVVLATFDAVEAVEPPDGVVPLEDTDLLAKVRQPDARREALHPRADDSDVVVGGGVHGAKRPENLTTGSTDAHRFEYRGETTNYTEHTKEGFLRSDSQIFVCSV